LSNCRISLSNEGDEIYDEETQSFYRIPVVRIRAKDREEAKKMASEIADQFGQNISFRNRGENR